MRELTLNVDVMPNLVFTLILVVNSWYVWDFNNVHNHMLLDVDFIEFLSSHRGVDDDDILQMNNFRKSGRRTSRACDSFANHYESWTLFYMDKF
jgi:hypothetical protein